MTVWLARAGPRGENEDFALDNNVAVIAYGRLGNLAVAETREQMEQLCREAYPDANPHQIAAWARQVWAFRGQMKRGDLLVLPLKTQSAIAVGRIAGDYRYEAGNPSGVRHTRPVEWLRTDMPRTAFDQDLLHSFGAYLTVCRISRNNAEERIRALIEKRPAEAAAVETLDEEGIDETSRPVDLDTYARDLIRAHISKKFREHELERLVEHLLAAEGYQTQIAPRGADGGADIIAGRGPMGFDAPRLCVQVKSGVEPLDVKVLRELHGVLRQFGADQGLLVAWGGFTRALEKEARRMFFEIRLWDADDVIASLLSNYERLPEALQAEIPLKRIWTLVQEPGEE